MNTGILKSIFAAFSRSDLNYSNLPYSRPASFVLPAITVLLLIAVSFKALQNDFIYHKTGKLVIRNYYHTAEGINKGEVPYVAFSNDEMLHWDAEIYDKIRKNRYDVQSAGGDYIFAFFPLFPALWKLSHLPPLGIALINYLFFAVSLFILMKITAAGKCANPLRKMIVWLCIPMLAVFLIPYTEGLFMLTSTIALYGIYRGRYSIYFPAALLMSMTRPSVIIIAVAVFLAELYEFISKGNLKNFLTLLSLRLLPVLTGTAIVSLIQLSYGSGSIFRFLEVQKYWNSSLRFPEGLTDWAHEQFGSNLALLIIAVPVLICLVYLYISKLLRTGARDKSYHDNSLNSASISGTINLKNTENRNASTQYLFVLSLLYIAGTVLSVVFMRGGSLNGLSRYIMCTPFYFIALSTGSQKLLEFRQPVRLFWFLSFLGISVLALSTVNYSRDWNFSDTGFMLLYSQAAFFIFPNLQKSNTFMIVHILLSAVWTSYLFNMFLSGVWIFT